MTVATPISKAPYQLAFSEPKELKTQMESFWINVSSDPMFHLGSSYLICEKRQYDETLYRPSKTL